MSDCEQTEGLIAAAWRAKFEAALAALKLLEEKEHATEEHVADAVIKPEQRLTETSRFGYIEYDSISAALDNRCKQACEDLETVIYEISEIGRREKRLALMQLEVVYARCGRAIRDAQIGRQGTAKWQKKHGNE